MTATSEPHLILLESDEEVDFPIPQGKTTIGRDELNDISLQDTSISRNHCYLVREGDEVRVFDADSRNLTRIGKKRVSGQILRDGEVLRLGRCHLLYKGVNSQVTESHISSAESDLEETRRASIEITEDVSDLETNALFSPTDPVHPPAPSGKATPALASAAAAPHAIRARERSTGSRGGLIFLVTLLLLGSVTGGIFLGGQLLGVKRSGGLSLLSGREGGEDVGQKLDRIQETLERQQEMIAKLGRELETTRELHRSLPAHLQKEIELHQRLRENETALKLEEVRRQERRRARQESTDSGSGSRTVSLEELGLEKVSLPWEESGEVVEVTAPQDSHHPSRRTSVANRPQKTEPPRREMSRSEVRELVEQLRAVVDEYADPGLTSDDFEPYLSALLSGLGREPADGLYEVQQHAGDLLGQIQKNIAFLDQRTKRLLDRARKEVGPPREGSGAGSRSKYGDPQKHEEEQRLLELSRKKIEILRTNAERLQELRATLLGGFRAFRDEEATRLLVDRFSHDEDVDFRLAALEALRGARARHAVPVLARKLVIREPSVREAVHQTLIAIVGEDLGETAPGWRDWYEENVKS